ncbi:MAG: 4-carboxymuconolactone decarboxylase [Gammaproteobacteria bacterium]|jgi:4-carboxymuconolactone decarboxylase
MESDPYEQRHARALNMLDAMMGGAVDPQEMADTFRRRQGALGSFAIDVVLGDVWSRTELSRRDRSLIVLAVLATIGSTEELSLHTQIGLNNGLSRSEVEEILLHIAAYAGYPMAMQASRIIDARFCLIDGVEQLPDREAGAALSDRERRTRAAEVRQTLTAGRASSDPEQDMAALISHLGEVGRIAYQWAFGEVWSRPELNRRDRSLIVISILTVLSRVDELAFHIPAGLNHGLSRIEVEEIMVQMTIYGGIPRAVEGVHAMKAAFAKLDAPSKR